MRTPAALFAALLALPALADAPPKTFAASYGGPLGFFNNGMGVATDAAGNIYSICESATGTGGTWAVVKYSPLGQVLWSRRDFPGGQTGSDRPFVVKLDPHGDVIIAGNSSGPSPSLDYAVVKLNPETGATIWTARWDDTGHGFNGLGEMTIDADGDVYVTGQSWSGVDYDWGTVKISGATGAILWSAREDGVAGGPDGVNDAAASLAVDDARNVYVTGWFQVDYDSNDEVNLYAPAVVKYDPSGAVAWRVVLGDAANQGSGVKVRIAPDGNIIAVTNRNGGAYTVKLSPADGSIIWEESWAGTSGNGATVYDAALDRDGNVILAGGFCGGSGFCAEGVGTHKTDGASGQEIWSNYYFDSANPNTAGGSARSVAIAPDGTVYAAGFQIYFNGVPGKAVAAAYDGLSGENLWTDLYLPPSSTAGGFSAVTTDAAGTAVFVGTRSLGGGNSRMLTVRYGCAADFNNDQFVDFFDIDAFIRCFEGIDCPAGRSADFNADGFVDFFDADAFIQAFETGC